MKPCKYCGEAFKPTGRQLYCKPEHKQAHDVDARREWRHLVRGVGKWVTAEHARDYRATRQSRYVQLADIVNDYGNGLSLVFPDALYEQQRELYEPEDVSYWPAVSAEFVWQLDGRWLKALDQQRLGVVIVTGLRRVYMPSLIPADTVTCDHWLNGVDPVRDCEHCERRCGIGEREPKHHGGVILFLDDIDDYKLARWPASAA